MFDEAPKSTNPEREEYLFKEKLILNEDGLLADPTQMLQLVHDLAVQAAELLGAPTMRLFISPADFTNIENLDAATHAISCRRSAANFRRGGIDIQDYVNNLKALKDEPVEGEEQQQEQGGIQWPQPPSFDPSRIHLN